ncbi:MAG: hypothetical protein ACREXM_10380 [Gammaproteobacteria bacterium]
MQVHQTPVLLLARQGKAVAAQDLPRGRLLQIPVERLCGRLDSASE